jgi:F0F1-type ATP synthase membrane subunit b/b'
VTERQRESTREHAREREREREKERQRERKRERERESESSYADHGNEKESSDLRDVDHVPPDLVVKYVGKYVVN